MSGSRKWQGGRPLLPTVGALLSVLGWGCIGTVEGAPATDAPGASMAVGGSGTTLNPNATSLAPGGGRLRILTRTQYSRSVERLLGAGATLPTDLDPDVAIAGYVAVGASTLGVAERRVEQLEAAAASLASEAVATPAVRQALVPCALSDQVSAICLTEFVASFGRRAFRRQLSEAEQSRYVALGSNMASSAANTWSGVQAVLTAMLQSPRFLYRRELGSAAADGSPGQTLDADELASRLSFFLEDSAPDDALFAAAAAGQLSSPEGLKVEAERLLATQDARESFRGFASETLQLSRLDELPQVPSLFPLLTATLGESLRTEALMAFDSVAFDAQRDFRDLLDTRETFVNAELARLYGLPEQVGSSFVKVSLPADGPRAGLLGQAAFLAGSSHASSPSATRRGQFIRETLLCQTIPPPPPEVSTTLPEDTPDTGHRTARQKLEVHQINPTCRACHAMMDPIGLGLEQFDALGSFRDNDQGLPIDSRSELDGVAFSNLSELSQLLRSRPEVSACVARNLFRFALGYEETPGETPLLESLALSFQQSGHRFQTLVLALVTSPEFRRAGAPK